MKKCITWILLLVTEGFFLVAASSEAQAKPSFGGSCMGCHGGTNQSGLMQVKDGTGILNIDAINLPTAIDRGPLKVFDVTPGNTVILPMDVLDGAELYAVEFKGLEIGAALNSASNHLIWSVANGAGNVWNQRGTAALPYFTKDNGSNGGIVWANQTTPYQFNLLVGAGTPTDVYDLQFAVATALPGDPTRYGEEHLYVRVIPEPATWTMLASFGLIYLAWFWRHRNR
jgi:hypothetical protein